jgi:hypothetical protein
LASRAAHANPFGRKGTSRRRRDRETSARTPLQSRRLGSACREMRSPVGSGRLGTREAHPYGPGRQMLTTRQRYPGSGSATSHPGSVRAVPRSWRDRGCSERLRFANSGERHHTCEGAPNAPGIRFLDPTASNAPTAGLHACSSWPRPEAIVGPRWRLPRRTSRLGRQQP